MSTELFFVMLAGIYIAPHLPARFAVAFACVFLLVSIISGVIA